jgi:subtilase family serine protease
MKGGKAMLATGRILGACLLFIGLSCAYGNAADGFLKATPEQIDTGTVPEGKTIEVTVSIQNVWNAPIEITSVRTS